MVEWVPGIGASPNRVDALVHGATDLMRGLGGPRSDQQSQFSSLAPPIRSDPMRAFKNSTSLGISNDRLPVVAVAVVTALSTARAFRDS